MNREDKQIHYDIGVELAIALQKLGANWELLCLVGSYGDSLSDEDVLSGLKHFNETGTTFTKIIASKYDT